LIRIGLVLSLIGAALLLVGPLGTRVGLWSFIIGFLMLALSVLLALVGASLALVGGVKTGQWLLASTAIIVGLGVVAVPSAFIVSARGKPAIHDITTDTDNPPAFVAILPLRPAPPTRRSTQAPRSPASSGVPTRTFSHSWFARVPGRRSIARLAQCEILVGMSSPAIARQVASKPSIRRSGSASKTMW
jgi:hypothetical protein